MFGRGFESLRLHFIQTEPKKFGFFMLAIIIVEYQIIIINTGSI